MNEPKENKMGTMPVGKLLVSMSLPMMASMLVQALYNIVDSIFVSRISETALTALSLAYPLQMLMFSCSASSSIFLDATPFMIWKSDSIPKTANSSTKSCSRFSASLYLVR